MRLILCSREPMPYVYTHIEVQGDLESSFAERMYLYTNTFANNALPIAIKKLVSVPIR